MISSKEEVLLNLIGEKKYSDFKKLQNIVKESNDKNDDKALKEMINIILNYSGITNNFYSFIIIKDLLNKYCDLSYRIISKMNVNNSTDLYKMFIFINKYTEDNINYKINIIKEYSKIGIIEERCKNENISYDFYKKLLQVLSIIYRKDNKKESEEIFEKSKTYGIQNKAKSITKKIVELNKKNYLINQEHFVKPTDDTMEIVCYLPDIIVDNEKEFKELINYLYKLFWESKAKDFAINKELDFINNIRRYFFHDLEHGRESDIKNKIKDVKCFYKEAINKPIPETAKDWQKVQEYIYNLLLDFLNKVEIKENI